MNQKEIIKFLIELGVSRNSMSVERGYVNSPCPLSKYTHGSGKDVRPSFGVKINDDGRSYYYCFGCSPSPHSLIRVVHNIWLFTSEYPYGAARLLLGDFSKNNVEERKQDVWETKKEEVYRKPIPKKVLRKYPLLQYSSGKSASACKNFLIKRGIPVWVQNYCKMRYDPRSLAVIFALTGIDGEIYLLRARSIREKFMWTISPKLAGVDHEFTKLRNVGAFFNMDKFKISFPVMVVEGELDAARLISLGYFNVIASATSSITNAQIDSISSDVIILGYDADTAGNKAVKRIVTRLARTAVLCRARWELVKCKDPGDLKNRKELKKILKNLQIIT